MQHMHARVRPWCRTGGDDLFDTWLPALSSLHWRSAILPLLPHTRACACAWVQSCDASHPTRFGSSKVRSEIGPSKQATPPPAATAATAEASAQLTNQQMKGPVHKPTDEGGSSRPHKDKHIPALVRTGARPCPAADRIAATSPQFCNNCKPLASSRASSLRCRRVLAGTAVAAAMSHNRCCCCWPTGEPPTQPPLKGGMMATSSLGCRARA